MAGDYLDVERWKHRDHFHVFRTFARPFFSVTVDVDVTHAWRRAKEPGQPSFSVAGLFAAVRAANAVEAMRLRVRGHRVWRYDRIGISSTVARADETFGFAYFAPADTLQAFAPDAARILDAVRAGTTLDDTGQDDVVYQSTLPWLRFTAFANALPLGDSIPRIVYGKCVADGHRMVMPVAVEVHHAVVQGIDVARYFDQLQAAFDGV